MNLYGKKNGQVVRVMYPVHGSRNVLRRVIGVKLKSYTGPNGKGITVTEADGKIRSLSLKKVVSL